MKRIAAVCVLALFVAACDGGNDRAELAAPTTVEELPTSTPVTTTTAPIDPGDAGVVRVPERVHEAIVAQAAAIEAALERWDDALASCTGTSAGDDAGGSCTRVAWEQLFDQLHVAHAELLRLIERTSAGPCHEALGPAVDAVHGFLSGATPTNVVWLDEQQRAPTRFDLEAIVDLSRSAPTRLRDAGAVACPS